MSSLVIPTLHTEKERNLLLVFMNFCWLEALNDNSPSLSRPTEDYQILG